MRKVTVEEILEKLEPEVLGEVLRRVFWRDVDSYLDRKPPEATSWSENQNRHFAKKCKEILFAPDASGTLTCEGFTIQVENLLVDFARITYHEEDPYVEIPMMTVEIFILRSRSEILRVIDAEHAHSFNEWPPELVARISTSDLPSF